MPACTPCPVAPVGVNASFTQPMLDTHASLDAVSCCKLGCAGTPDCSLHVICVFVQGGIMFNTAGKRFVDELSTRDKVSNALLA